MSLQADTCLGRSKLASTQDIDRSNAMYNILLCIYTQQPVGFLSSRVHGERPEEGIRDPLGLHIFLCIGGGGGGVGCLVALQSVRCH